MTNNNSNSNNVIGPISTGDWRSMVTLRSALGYMLKEKDTYTNGIDKYSTIYKDTLSKYLKVA